MQPVDAAVVESRVVPIGVPATIRGELARCNTLLVHFFRDRLMHTWPFELLSDAGATAIPVVEILQ